MQIILVWIYYCWFHENGSIAHSCNQDYLSHRIQVAGGTLFKKHMVYYTMRKYKKNYFVMAPIVCIYIRNWKKKGSLTYQKL